VLGERDEGAAVWLRTRTGYARRHADATAAACMVRRLIVKMAASKWWPDIEIW
jgi:hypothetical protein